MKMSARKWAVLAAAAVLAVAGIVAAVYSSAPRGSSVYASVKIEATKVGQYGVEPDSSFSVTLDRAVDEEAVRAMLRTEPELSYTLTGGGKRWTLVPETPLAENAVYTFRVVNETGAIVRSYAFQTKSGLLVETAYPRPGATWVELATGIELTFNTVGVDVADHFTIEPSIAGEFHTTESTVVFVPQEPLLPDSIYRVTLKAGLTAANGMVLAEDYTFQFETIESDEKGRYEDLALLGSFDETFLPGDPIVLKMRGGDMSGAQMTVAVHRFADTQAYAAELQKRAAFYNGRSGVKQEYEVQTQTMEPLLELTTELTPGDRWWSTSWAVLPDSLPEGCYLMTLRGESPAGREQFVQKVVQVCNVAAYAQAANGDAVVWLNDASTGGPMPGARVQLQEMDGAEQRAGVTDEQGMLTLRTDEMENAWLSVTDGGKLAYFGELELSKAAEEPLYERYYSAVYKDRELYQPTDTVKFWGMLRPRGEEKTPEAAHMVLSQGGSVASALYKTRVELLPDGTFQGELAVTGLEAGWYNLMLTDGGEGVYWSGSIQVQQFTKPPLVITAQADKGWYYVGDTVNMAVTAAYYDGTPAAGAQLRFNCPGLTTKEVPEPEEPVAQADDTAQENPGASDMDDQKQEGVVITLDAQGSGSYSATLTSGWDSWSPHTVFYDVVSADTQEVYLETTGQVLTTSSRYTCEVSSPQNGTLLVKTNRLDEEAMEQQAAGEADYSAASEFERLSGVVTELPVTVEFMKSVSYQVPDGTYYDEINNETVIRYRYEREETLVRTEETRTVNGQASISYDPAWATPDEDTTYWVRVRFDGGCGFRIQEQYYIGRSGGEPENIRRYTFASTEGWSYGSINAAIGAEIPLGLYENDRQVKNTGSVLYSRIADGISQPAVFTGDGASVTFQEVDIPNIAIAGAYFDGRHVFEISPYEIYYDYKERTLDVQVKAEQDAYAPGGEAKLTVTLRDAAGNPVAGTACIGVVDESIFALVEQNVDFVGQIYSNLRSTSVMQRSSYKEYNLSTNPDTAGGMGGGGDGDGIALRSDFQDTALFQTVAVDESGTGTLTVTLPDNVTKWRLTAAAVTTDGKAGDGKGAVVSTLPFYVRAVVTNTYLVGDDLTMGALAVGTELSESADVAYTAQLLGANGKPITEQTKQAKAGEQVYLNFGKQPEGQYTVRVTAKSGEQADGVELPVTVAKTGAVVKVNQRVALSELSGVQPERWPAVVDIYDVRLEPYMESLRVLSGRSGERTEILAAAYRAQVAQNELLPEDERGEVTKDGRLFALQDYESGVKPLPNAEPEAAVTAKMLLSAPQLVNGEFAKIYLKNVLKDAAATQDSRVMAYVGLAALHEPVMLDIARLLEDETLNVSQRLYLGAGLAALGDYEGAVAVYDGAVAQNGKSESGEAEKIRRSILGVDENESQRNTGAALLLCSIAGHTDADGLASELCAVMQEKQREDATVLTDLELLAYTRYFRFNLGEQASFSYLLDGKRETVELGYTGAKSLTLSAQAFATADFKSGRGKTMANIRYSSAAALPESVPDNGLVTVEKIVTPLDYDFKAPGLARVDIRLRITAGAPEGAYTVFDAIPSGMRYMPYTGGDEIEPRFDGTQVRMENEGQQMHGSVWFRQDEDGIMPLTEEMEQTAETSVAADVELAADTGAVADVELTGDPDIVASAVSVAENPSTDDSAIVEPGSEEATGTDKEYSFTYYVNGSLPGGYVLESTYVTDPQGNIVAMTPRGTVEIK